jgi:hypothetical protein
VEFARDAEKIGVNALMVSVQQSARVSRVDRFRNAGATGGDSQCRCAQGMRGTALVRIQRRELRADTVDISAHGVCLTLPRALEVGSTCELDLELEIQGATTRHTSVVARVCFCLHGKNGYRIGLNCALEDFVGDGAA